MFSGSFVALTTAFRDGQADVAALQKLAAFQIQNGANGLVPCGTTGESVTMTQEDDQLVIRTVVEVAAQRVPSTTGTGSNDTQSAIDYTSVAQRLGADGALLVTPQCSKPTRIETSPFP